MALTNVYPLVSHWTVEELTLKTRIKVGKAVFINVEHKTPKKVPKTMMYSDFLICFDIIWTPKMESSNLSILVIKFVVVKLNSDY